MSEVSKEQKNIFARLRNYPIIVSIFLTVFYGLLLFGILYPISLAVGIAFYDNGILSFIPALFLFFFILFISMGVLWMVIIPLVFKMPDGRTSFKEYQSSIGLTLRSPLTRLIAIGLGFTLIYFVNWFVAVSFSETFSPDIGAMFAPPDLSDLGWFVIIFALLPGVWEEVAFHGVIFTLLLKKYSQKTTILVSGILFGLFHFFNLIIGSITPSTVLYQVLFASFVGISVGYLRAKTGSLVPGIIYHYLMDSFVTLIISGLFTDVSDLTLYSPIGVILFGLIPAVLSMVFVWIIKRKPNPVPIPSPDPGSKDQ